MPDRTCSLDGCDRKHFATAMCQMHYFRTRRNGNPHTLRGQDKTSGPDHANWIGDQVTYIGAHFRVQRARGSATLHDCIDCYAPAADWSYNHDDPHELRDGRGYPYSADPEQYDPRCKSCHIRFDNRARARRTA